MKQDERTFYKIVILVTERFLAGIYTNLRYDHRIIELI